MNRQSVMLDPRSRGRCGFTLVEVLAAMVFLGVVIPVAMRCVSTCLQATANARHLLEASELAEQKMAQILVERDASNLEGSGDFSPDWPEYTWQIESSTFDTGISDVTGVYLVTVHVRWFQRTTQRSFDLTSLMYPDTSSSADITTTSGGTTQ